MTGLFWLALLLAPVAQAELRSHQTFGDVNSHEARYGGQGLPEPLECFQITHPISTDVGLGIGNQIIQKHEPLPACSLLLMKHSFGNSYGKPYVAPYQPPPCDFDKVFINVTVRSQGRQFDRLATMWLGDVEVWRTSTAEPTPSPGIVWHFLKNMTPYLALWRQKQTLIFDLGNIVDDTYTGPFNVTMTATFFKSGNTSSEQETRAPADLVLPISAKKSPQNSPSAFIFPESEAEATFKLPSNVHTAILTVAATGQAGEEFWWSNVPESAAGYFNSSGGDKLPGLSSFREVRVYIDGEVAGLVWPFPVVFTGGISPPLHRPMVGLQAFDLRETEVDITPWLGFLCDGEEHTISLDVFGVDDTDRSHPKFAPVGENWVLSAKIFVWVDSKNVKPSKAPSVFISPVDFEVEVGHHGPSAFSYKQSITREINVSGDAQAGPGVGKQVGWTQGYSMRNHGTMRDTGQYQQVNSSYSGHSLSTRASGPGLATQFRYPISTTNHYRKPHGPDSLSIEAVLAQEIDLSVTLDSPLTTGVEPFLDKLYPGVTGSKLHAQRGGYAFLYSGGGGNSSSITNSQTTENYKLSALSPDKLDSTHVDALRTVEPRLYERSTTVANDSVISDEEIIWNGKTRERAPVKNQPIKAKPEFALMPMRWPGGANVVMKGYNDLGKALGPTLAFGKATIDQQSGASS